MQLCEAHEQKKSLFTAMSRFIGAVNDMQQTVMVPSLLRDVPLEDGDMYGSYVLLKSIRDHVEWGGVQRDGRAEEEEEELEKRFHFHLNGLHGVLSQLTRRANTLTRRYKQEVGL